MIKSFDCVEVQAQIIEDERRTFLQKVYYEKLCLQSKFEKDQSADFLK